MSHRPPLPRPPGSTRSRRGSAEHGEAGMADLDTELGHGLKRAVGARPRTRRLASRHCVWTVGRGSTPGAPARRWRAL